MRLFQTGYNTVNNNNNFNNFSNTQMPYSGYSTNYHHKNQYPKQVKWQINEQYDLPLPIMPSDLRMPFQIKWSPVDDILVIPSQDGNFRCWRVIQPQYYGKLRCQCLINCDLLYKIYDMQFLPDGVGLFTADLDGCVRLLDLQTMKSYLIGSHQGGVNTISFHQSSNMAISLGEDRIMKFWDFREPPMNPIYELESAAGIPMFADLQKNTYVHCTNANVIEVINLQILRMGNGSPVYAVFDSPTFHSVQNLKLSSNAMKLVMTGAEGRVVIRSLHLNVPFDQREMANPTKNEKHNFQFRSPHRQILNKGQPNEEEYINSINDISFSPAQQNILTTCGGDGNIFVWDIEKRASLFKCRPLPESKTPVSNIEFNRNGNLLAFIVGDDGSRGSYPKEEWGQGQFVRNLVELRKKARQKPSSSKYF